MKRHTKIWKQQNILRLTLPVYLTLVVMLISFLMVQADAHPVGDADDEPQCTGAPRISRDSQPDEFICLPVVVAIDWQGSWTRVGEPVKTAERFYSVAVCDVHILAGSDTGIFSLKSPATVWEQEQTGISGAITDVSFVPGICTQAYAAVQGHGVWRGVYANNDWTWLRVDDGQLKEARSIAILGTSGSDATIYAAGAFGVNWLSALPTAPVTWQTTTLKTLTTSLKAGQTLLAAVWNDGVYQAGPGGWSRLGPTNAPEDKLVYQAAFANDRGVVGTQTGAFLWSNNTWTRVQTIEQTVFTVAIGDQGIFVGQRNSGVFGSADSGQTWYPANSGLDGVGNPEFQVRNLTIYRDGDNETLYAATTNGIWKWSGKP